MKIYTEIDIEKNTYGTNRESWGKNKSEIWDQHIHTPI